MKVTELLRVSADIYGPGAVVTPTMFRYIAHWNLFHTRRILFPIEPMALLFKPHEDGAEALQDIVHLRVTVMSGVFTSSVTDGEFDFLMVDNRLDWLLGNNLPRMAAKAVTVSPPYMSSKTFASWLELWEIEGKTATFLHDDVDLELLRKEPPK